MASGADPFDPSNPVTITAPARPACALAGGYNRRTGEGRVETNDDIPLTYHFVGVSTSNVRNIGTAYILIRGCAAPHDAEALFLEAADRVVDARVGAAAARRVAVELD